MSEVSSIVCTFLCNVQIIYIHAYTIFFLFFSCILLINQTHTHTDLWLSWRLWNDQGRRFQTHGRDHQSEAYQATLTQTLSSMTSPSTTSDAASHLLYRFDSPPESAFSDPYPPSFSLCLCLCLCVSLYLSIFVCVSVSLCSYFCCFCVSLFMCLLSSISHSHCLTIHTQQI